MGLGGKKRRVGGEDKNKKKIHCLFSRFSIRPLLSVGIHLFLVSTSLFF